MSRIRSIFFLFVLAIALAACGRDDVTNQQPDACESNDDCAATETCESGACVEVLNNVLPNDCTTDGCAEGEACDPATLECVDATCQPTEEGGCAQVSCNDEGCMPLPCDIGCKDFEEQVGCDCEPVGCTTDAECGDFFCEDGTCRGCTDADCAVGDFCDTDGVCKLDTRCGSDADCAAREACVEGRCEARDECVLDRDCDGGELCLGGQCTLAPECSAQVPCPEGFECVGDTCFESICRGPDDCGNGEICEAGECVEPAVAASCVVASASQTIVEGQSILLDAFAYDSNGNSISAPIVWASSDSAVASIVGSTALGGASGGSTTITATLGTGDPIACMGDLTLTNPGPAPMNNFRATVFDADSGAPVQGAEVLVDGQTATTDAAGVATLPLPTGAFDVTVASNDHNWVSLVGINSTDIRVPLTVKQGTGPVAGFSGEFDESMINSSGDVTLGLAGASLTGGLLDVNLTRLLGDSFVRRLNIPGIVDTDIPLPGGVVVYGGAFGFQIDLKEEYYATAPGGGRIAWGLAGNVPIRDLIGLFMGGGGGTGDVLSLILPLFNRFDHGSKASVLAARPRVTDTADFDGDLDTTEQLPDYANFPNVELQPSVRQTLVSDVAISRFPTLSSGTADAAVLVGGAVQGNVGFIPLGISATNDEDGDGFPDSRRLTVAPPYGSITGGRFAVLAIAFGDGGGAGPGGFDLPDELSVALWNGQSLPAGLSLGTFPDASTITLDRMTRSVGVTADAGPLYRVRIVGADRTWDVWSTGPAGQMGTFNHSIAIPAAPGMQTDYLTSGDVLVDAIQTNVSLDQLVRANGVGLTNAGLVSTAFNRTAAP